MKDRIQVILGHSSLKVILSEFVSSGVGAALMIKQNMDTELCRSTEFCTVRSFGQILTIYHERGNRVPSAGCMNIYNAVETTYTHMSPSHTKALLGHQNEAFENLTSAKFVQFFFKLTVAVLEIL